VIDPQTKPMARETVPARTAVIWRLRYRSRSRLAADLQFAMLKMPAVGVSLREHAAFLRRQAPKEDMCVAQTH
jgi:hypothetical protein